jgi:predicted SnoaL-like aldol condensation-catalyzing enzyme
MAVEMKLGSVKETAVAFLTLAATGKVREAYEQFVSKGFRHHNPFYKGDRDTLMRAMIDNSEKNPKRTYEMKRAVEEGGLVAVHSHIRPYPEVMGFQTFHLFRFEEGKIAEMWDVVQPLPETSPNENGIF